MGINIIKGDPLDSIGEPLATIFKKAFADINADPSEWVGAGYAVNDLSGKTIGHVVFDLRERWVKTIVVDDEYRNQGIGLRLLQYALEHIEGDRPIYITVMNEPMLRVARKANDPRLVVSTM